MNVELLNYLSAMETQAREIENQNSRLRSIQKSVDKLKTEQSRLKEPQEPQPEDLSNTFVAKTAKWGGVVIGGVFLCAFLSQASSALLDFLVLCVSAFAIGWMAEKLAASILKERERQAQERLEAARQQWEADKARYFARKDQIPKQLRQLEADSRTASQAKQRAQAQLSQMGQKLGLHSDYWSVYALSHIHALLDHGRADTLKEALNRYEAEKRQSEHNAEMSYYASEQAEYARQQAESARRAADAAEYQAEYERQQAEHAAAIRDDVSEMERRQRQQEWDRMWGN